MTEQERQSLKEGDIIRHRVTGAAMVVVGNDGRTVMAVRMQTVTNPSEWDLMRQHKVRRED